MRSLLGFGVSVFAVIAVMVPSCPADAAPSASASLSTQRFTGGGHGGQGGSVVNYDSTGQLGSGLYFSANLDSVRPQAKGPAHLVRPDGVTLTGTDQPGNSCGAIPKDTYCMTADLTGTADIASAHIDLVVKPEPDTRPGKSGAAASVDVLMRGTLTLRRRIGYEMLGAHGAVYRFGGLDSLGDAPTSTSTDLELTPSHNGYWIVNATGQTFAFGDAPYLGNADASTFSRGEVVTSISATPTGRGLWLFTSAGRALAFGDAAFLGDLHATRLNGRIVDSVATPTGRGYYMVGTDGGVFAFGDARFRGSMGSTRLNRPVVSLVPTVANDGYWLVASDGGVFSFHAPFFGSLPELGLPLTHPVVSMARQSVGYLMVTNEGGVYNFGGGLFFGSKAATHLAAPIVSATAAP